MTKRKTLSDVLADFKRVSPHFGEQSDAERIARLNNFRTDLQTVSASNKQYFSLCIALLLVLFVGACALVLRFLTQPGQVSVIFGVTGISFMGIITHMAHLWKEKVNSDLLIVLAGNLEEKDLKQVVNALLRASSARVAAGATA